jgi:hypothetical protein
MVLTLYGGRRCNILVMYRVMAFADLLSWACCFRGSVEVGLTGQTRQHVTIWPMRQIKSTSLIHHNQFLYTHPPLSTNTDQLGHKSASQTFWHTTRSISGLAHHLYHARPTPSRNDVPRSWHSRTRPLAGFLIPTTRRVFGTARLGCIGRKQRQLANWGFPGLKQMV